MNHKTSRFVYSMLFTLCVALIAMYSAYSHTLRTSGIDFSKPPQGQAFRRQAPNAQEMLASSLESSQDTQAAFTERTLIKVGLPDWVGEVNLSAPGGILYSQGQAPLIKVRLVTTFFQKVKLALYDGEDHLLLSTTEPLTLGAAEGTEEPICQVEIVDPLTGAKTYSAYRGQLTLTPQEAGIKVVNHLALEDYLKGVVPSEVPARFEPEALKAMACVARSYTLASLGCHKEQGYDLCSEVHCHVYGGAGVEDPKINAQIEATAGQMVCWGKMIADTRYHAVCGGCGEGLEYAWPQAQPVNYLVPSSDLESGQLWTPAELLATISRSNLGASPLAAEPVAESDSLEGGELAPNRAEAAAPPALEPGASLENTPQLEAALRHFIDDPGPAYCQEASRFRWRAEYTLAELSDQLRESLPVLVGAQPTEIGDLQELQILRRSPSGRALQLAVVTSLGSFTLSHDQMRWMVGGGKINPSGLRSTLFYIEPSPEKIAFVGGGWGHGVGLCQEGAQGRALAGQDYLEIISHYYPGCEVLLNR